MGDGTCSVEACDRPVKCLGWCEAHYHRWRKYGDVRAHIPLQKRRVLERARADCSVEGCGKPVYARGWCVTCYARWYKRPDRSDPAERRYITGDDEARFWSKVNKQGPSPTYRPELGSCWLWTAGLDTHGYGHINVDGHLVLAHRYAYEAEVHVIPAKLELDHLCRVHACVNPQHLEPVTRAVNVQRGVEGRRAERGGTCVNGHPWVTENIYVWPDGKRTSCRLCVAGYQARYRERTRGSPTNLARLSPYAS